MLVLYLEKKEGRHQVDKETQGSCLDTTLPFDGVAGRLSIDFFLNCELLSAPALCGDI